MQNFATESSRSGLLQELCVPQNKLNIFNTSYLTFEWIFKALMLTFS